MWDGLFMILGLSAVMGLASFLAGMLPLSFTLSPGRMRLITACGTGVLVGTALIVIIPEGIETLYAARPAADAHTLRSLDIQTRGAKLAGRPLASIARSLHQDSIPGSEDHTIFVGMMEGDSSFTGPDHGRPSMPGDDGPMVGDDGRPSMLGDVGTALGDEGKPSKPVHDGTTPVDADRSQMMTDFNEATKKKAFTGSGDERETSGHDISTIQPTHEFEPHAWIGVSLVLGFIVMYLIDRLPKLASSSSRQQPSYISLDRLGLRRSSSAAEAEAGGDFSSDNHIPAGASSLTTGLVIHAAADGIALGASTTSPSQRLGFIIFIALMIHKAPAAFGLTAVLLKQGVTRRKAKAYLAIFSLAAPVGALATWTTLHVLGGSFLEESTTADFATGILLLFSGGTFLYVAVHAMQDAGHDDESATNGTAPNGYADPYGPSLHKQDKPGLMDAIATVAGMLLPLLTQVGHSH